MNSALYRGWLRHRRHDRHAGEFRYRLFMTWIDLDELETVFAGRWLWSVGRRNVVAFHREDYLGPADRPLADVVRDLVESRIGRRPEGPIRMLTNLRALGYCFNPVSFYWCHDRDGAVEAIVADITNTPWGERHQHVLDRRASSSPGKTWRVRHAKELHVSPFMAMGSQYEWRFTAPDDRLAIHVDVHRDGDRELDATLVLDRCEITTRSLATTLAAHPFITGKVIAAIYWQALRLLLRGAPVQPHPSRSALARQEISP